MGKLKALRRTLCIILVGICMAGLCQAKKKEKRLKLIDATTTSLNLNDCRWTKFKGTKGGIKINMRFDCCMECADYLSITTASRHRTRH